MSFLEPEPRDQLIGAAAALCSERGYDEISETDIATRAGVPTEKMAELFSGGKEDCFAAAENAILLEVVSAVSHGYSADRSEWENVIHGVLRILRLMADNPDFAYLGYIFARHMAPGRVREGFETGHHMLEAMLQRGWNYSESKDQPASAALGVLGGAQALVRRDVAAGRAERLPLILPECVYIATVPFLGQRTAMLLVRQARELVEAEADVGK